MIRDIAKCFIKSFLAGIMIAMGGTIFLSLQDKVLGATFFSIGLFMIVINGLNLYTGKIGYVLENDLKYLIEVGTTIVGNFMGTFLIGFILKFTRIYPSINEKAISMCNIKLDDSIISILILSIMCGLLMYLAVNGYKVMKDPIAKYGSVFLCVIVFILCGFEHSIANMYYFSVADMWNIQSFGYLIIMILGNAIGGNIIPVSNKLRKALKDETV